MTRARFCLLLPLLAIAACQTERKPIRGFDKPPPGILLDGTSRVVVWPIFDLPLEPMQLFGSRLNGQAGIRRYSDNEYDYYEFQLQGWAGTYERFLDGIPPGTYIVELVDSAGHTWGQPASLTIPEGLDYSNPSTLFPVLLFTDFGGQKGAWTIDPATQDSDAATSEITVTSLIDEDVVVERCLIAAAVRTSCTPVGTVAPGADFLTVEREAGSSMSDHQALFIHLARDASQSYQRDLVKGGGSFGPSCQIERILVHGERPAPADDPMGLTGFAMSSCYGYRGAYGP